MQVSRHVYNLLLEILRDEIKKRTIREPEEWAEHERMAMYFAINKYRKHLGKPELLPTSVKFDNKTGQADDDYPAAFASHCVQLILEGT